ncbi:MAG: N-acetylgalactosamine transporter subunit [Proteobacteria bacterium]|nr:N-acetylgalactosamine transporter subunit [Pseudomonadota bacterium]
MLGIILTGHGGFASGLEQAMKQILGEQPQFIAIDFPETSTTARLTAQLEQAMSELDAQHDIVFLTDLLGGTPFRVASTLAMQRPGSEVITGTNLQLLLEMVLERDGLTSEAFRLQALECGHRPARLLGIDRQFGSLTPGKRANIIALDSGLNLQQIWIQGQALPL